MRKNALANDGKNLISWQLKYWEKNFSCCLFSGDVLLEASLWSLREIMQATISKNCISKIVFLYLVLKL